MKHFITLACAILLSCGGGGGSVGDDLIPDPNPTPVGVSGLSGSISDIEFIDVD